MILVSAFHPKLIFIEKMAVQDDERRLFLKFKLFCNKYLYKSSCSMRGEE